MAKNEEILAQEIDKKKISNVLEKIDRNAFLLDEIIVKIVAKYSEPLDSLMHKVREVLSDTEQEITDQELDSLVMKIPVQLYFIGDALENLGVREDVAKAVEKEIFNETYSKSAGTVADKSAAAELQSQQEYITRVIVSRCYKKIKVKLDAAYEMLGSVKKVLSRRMQSIELSFRDRGN